MNRKVTNTFTMTARADEDSRSPGKMFMLTNALETASSHCDRVCHTASRMLTRKKDYDIEGLSCKLLTEGEWHSTVKSGIVH